jgi:hypothetical protein
VTIGVRRADIDVESARHIAERAPQQDILEVLGVRDECHAGDFGVATMSM